MKTLFLHSVIGTKSKLQGLETIVVERLKRRIYTFNQNNPSPPQTSELENNNNLFTITNPQMVSYRVQLENPGYNTEPSTSTTIQTATPNTLATITTPTNQTSIRSENSGYNTEPSTSTTIHTATPNTPNTVKTPIAAFRSRQIRSRTNRTRNSNKGRGGGIKGLSKGKSSSNHRKRQNHLLAAALIEMQLV